MTAERPWGVYHPAPGVVHIIPEHDDIAHGLRKSCVCGPQTDPDGVIVHNSLDGRELVEDG